MLAVAVLLWGSGLTAQTPADTLARRQQRTLDSLAAAMRALQGRVDSLARPHTDTSAGDDLAALRAAAAAAAPDSGGASAPRQARLGQNALNPEISATGDVRASVLRPGPQTDPFNAHEFEFSFQSALDPYSATKIFLSIANGEIDVEEGYAYYAGLPGHFRLDIGKFRQQIGELNRWHGHALPEGELPLAHRVYLGDEGLASTGVSVYWPLPFSGGRAGTYELYAQATRGSNDSLFAGGSRPSWLSQLSGFFQFSRSTYAQVSVTGLYGTNPDTSLKTAVGVVAARFSWRPPNAGTRRNFTLRGEWFALRRRFAGVGPTRHGGYVDATVQLSQRWIAGVRGDYVELPGAGNFHETEIVPTLTYWQSEFVYLRGQLTHHRDALGRDSERIQLQAVWAMGPHKHEIF